ncbi:MAG TPA: hypothetical protein VIL07_00985 [Symbiobacteriaceae bacterium]
MDWPKARAILLVAFLLVNGVLAYAIWGPDRSLPGLGRSSHAQEVEQVRTALAERGIILPASVTVPETPPPMRFLRVEFRPTPPSVLPPNESSSRDLEPARFLPDPDSGALIYYAWEQGAGSRDIRPENRSQVQQVAEEYLRRRGWLPANAVVATYRHDPDRNVAMVEFVPSFDGLPVFSGYVRVEVSSRGVETVRFLWVEPTRYTDAAPKAVRPATEALLRLAGRLQDSVGEPRVIRDIRLGYYANRSLTGAQPEAVIGWDTVPVWRIELESGEVYYVNGFNGEWES